MLPITMSVGPVFATVVTDNTLGVSHRLSFSVIVAVSKSLAAIVVMVLVAITQTRLSAHALSVDGLYLSESDSLTEIISPVAGSQTLIFLGTGTSTLALSQASGLVVVSTASTQAVLSRLPAEYVGTMAEMLNTICARGDSEAIVVCQVLLVIVPTGALSSLILLWGVSVTATFLSVVLPVLVTVRV